MPVWDDVKKNLKSWYDSASDRTGEMARIGVKRYDIFGISRDIERQFSEIGSLVYNALRDERDDVLQDPTLLGLVERIKALESELAAKEADIATIKSERSASRAASAEPAGEDVPPAAMDAEPVDAEFTPVEEEPQVAEPSENPVDIEEEDKEDKYGGE